MRNIKIILKLTTGNGRLREFGTTKAQRQGENDDHAKRIPAGTDDS
jgi:hypothetical protein